MAKEAKRIPQECIYCGDQATTKDHIPSRNLFADSSEKSWNFVPSCEPCNKGFSNDEEYFRLLVASAAIESSPDALELYSGPIRRSMTRSAEIAKNQPLLRKLLSRLQLVQLKSPSGIYVGKQATKYTITTDDWKRHYRVLEKTARGVYFHETGKRVPEGASFKHKLMNADDIRLNLGALQALPIVKKSHVYTYHLGVIDEPFFSFACLSVYYEKIPFLTMATTNPEQLRAAEERTKSGIIVAHGLPKN